jgi:hypothetical protein
MDCNTICKHAINLKISLPYKKKVKIINISDVLSEVITTYCMDVSFTSFNRQWEGIGITNIHGGVEYLDPELSEKPMTIGCNGISIISTAETSACIIFFNMLDFLKYQSNIILTSQNDCADYILLNSPNNICELLDRLGDYQTITSHFPQTPSGQTLQKTIFHLYNSTTMKQTKNEKVEMLQEYILRKINEFIEEIDDLELHLKDGQVVGKDEDGREFDVVVEWNLNPHNSED